MLSALAHQQKDVVIFVNTFSEDRASRLNLPKHTVVVQDYISLMDELLSVTKKKTSNKLKSD